MAQRTRAELQSLVQIGLHEITELREKTATLERQIRSKEAECRRLQSTAASKDAMLLAGKNAIKQHLNVHFQCGLTPEMDFRGDPVAESVSEDVLFLRHLHEIINDDPPF
jgi:hypothetical protein